MKLTHYPGKILKTMLIPGATFCAVPLMLNGDIDCTCPKLCKPSELPIYGSTDCTKCVEPTPQIDPSCVPAEEPNILERSIRNLREGFTDMYGKFQQQKETLDDKIKEGTDSVKYLVVFLREEQNETHRMGAIAMGGLAGLILGLRGGIFRKLIYMSAGAGGMYYICYPEDAERNATEGLALTRQYVKIAYNFMYGVKPGDEPLPLPTLPKMPENLNETFELVGDLVLKAKNAILPEAKKEGASADEKK